MRIKNRGRFTLTMTIVFITLMFIVLSTGQSFSKVEIKTKTIYASYGDTLWKIASEEQENNIYYEGQNVRDIIEDIKYYNNLDNSYIYEGQKIEIPTL